MRRSGRAAAAFLRLQALKRTDIVPGYCLHWARRAWLIGPGAPDAISAWQSTPLRYRHGDWRLAPAGACHYWDVGQHGHIAIQAAKRGYVWSTDAPKSGRIGLVHHIWFEVHWKAKYLGWTNYLHGEELPLKGMQ